MRRRQYLARLGAAGSVSVTAVAGCASPGQEPEGEDTPTGEEGTPTEEGEETPTEEETPTDGEEETPTDGEEETPTDGGGEGTQAEGGTSTSVAMITEGDEYIFDPIGLHVEPGTEITWVNESGSHSSTAYTEDNPQSEVRRIPEDAEGWNSETISEEGGEFSHTFDVEGTYDYYCIPHKALGMVGRLVVGEPSGLDDDPPDGAVPSEDAIVEEGAISYEDFDG